MSTPRLTSLHIEGYRPFRDFTADLGPLEVIVGANGAGKSALFEFLRFIRDSISREIPPEVIEGSTSLQIFHQPGSDRFSWKIGLAADDVNIEYRGQIAGPLGMIRLTDEKIVTSQDDTHVEFPIVVPVAIQPEMRVLIPRKVKLLDLKLLDRLDNFSENDRYGIKSLETIRTYTQNWFFASSDSIALEKIRRPVVIEQDPELKEDFRNLSSMLHYLMTVHRSIFDEIQLFLRLIVPGFRELTVKARGGPGEVIAFWREDGTDIELSLADLSDGTLNLLCWLTLLSLPNPPALICIDEPDQGLHPRTLAALAGFIQKASSHTQILVATHSSYFLTQFTLDEIAVMKKEKGNILFCKPEKSAVIRALLNDDFSEADISYLHWSRQLEDFS